MKKISFLIMILAWALVGCGSDAGPKNVVINNLVLSETKDGPGNIQNVFKDISTIYLSFEVSDFYRKNDGIVWIQEDVQLTGPDGKILEWASSLGEINKFDYQNYLDINKKMPGKISVIPLSNVLSLPAGSVSGEYKLLITVRDKIGRSQASKEVFFKLNVTEKKKGNKK